MLKYCHFTEYYIIMLKTRGKSLLGRRSRRPRVGKIRDYIII